MFLLIFRRSIDYSSLANWFGFFVFIEWIWNTILDEITTKGSSIFGGRANLLIKVSRKWFFLIDKTQFTYRWTIWPVWNIVLTLYWVETKITLYTEDLYKSTTYRQERNRDVFIIINAAMRYVVMIFKYNKAAIIT